VQASAVIWETLLGVWLLSRKNPFLSWLAAVVTFAAFAMVSGYLGVIGQATCGCFGVIKASPWAAFGVDVVVLGLLAVGRPHWPGWRSVRGEVLWLGCGVTALGLIAGGLLWRYGSVDAATGAIRGDNLLVSDHVLEFGTGRPSDVLRSTVRLRNNSDHPIRLLGGAVDCTCLFPDATVTIPPGESVEQVVLLRIPQGSDAGQSCRDAQLYSDSPANPLIPFKLCCRIVN
jgi:hypothetical protein